MPASLTFPCTRVPDSGVDPGDAGRYYSFDWGDIHFATIDTNLLLSDSSTRMLEWLENDLRNSRKFWKIVFLHHAPYPTGHHLGDVLCAQTRALVNPIVERYGVHLVLGGHEHGYERTLPLVDDQPVDMNTRYHLCDYRRRRRRSTQRFNTASNSDRVRGL